MTKKLFRGAGARGGRAELVGDLLLELMTEMSGREKRLTYPVPPLTRKRP